MDKREFLKNLRAALDGLPDEDLEERLLFYAEMIDDRVEDGLTEEEAVLKIGNVEDVAAQIVAEIPFSKIVKEKVKRKGKPSGAMLALLVLGSPIWLSLIIAVLAVVFALYVSIWAVLISVWVVDLSFAVSALGCVLCGFAVLGQGAFPQMLLAFSAACLLAGFAILLFFACVKLTKVLCGLTKKSLVGIKARLVRKEKKNA